MSHDSESQPTSARRPKGLPLAFWVTLVVVGLLAIATATIGISAFANQRTAIDGLWGQLSEQLAGRVVGEVQRFVAGARPITRRLELAVQRDSLDLSDDRVLRDALADVLDANPKLTWMSWGGEDGRYIAAYRWPSEQGEDEVRSTVRRVTSPTTTSFDDQVRTNAGWQPTKQTRRSFYDPRQRPWYKAVSKAPEQGGRWVDPYVMTSRQQSGIAYAYPVVGTDRALQGVFAAEYEAGPIARFLAALNVSANGRAYLLDAHGYVIAHPGGKAVTITKEGKGQLIAAPDHPDVMLREVAVALGQRAVEADGHIDVGDTLAIVRGFPEDTGIPWRVVLAAPSDDFFASVRAQARQTVIISIIVLVLALLAGILFARRLSRSVSALREDMARIARFDVGEDDAQDVQRQGARTYVREVAAMRDATATMKQGLRSFGRYVPQELVRTLLKDGGEAAIGGRMQQLTIAFTDIEGFTSVAQTLPPTELLEALGAYLDGMNVAIADHHGTAAQYLGDAVLAFWGAPKPLENHALWACRGVLHMRAFTEELLRRAAEQGRPKLYTRFGVNTGDVLVGNIGAPQRFNYGILGDPVNIAARLEGLNKVYGTQIIIGPDTAAAVSGDLVVRPLDRVKVKGRSEGLDIFELVGDAERVTAEEIALCDRYAAALEHYRAGTFADAEAGFRACAADGDTPSQVMAERAAACLATPPPAGEWRGIHIMTTK
ncbi:MAG: adenylate cyclase [Myxococcota bacterium]|jgi:adenylate cyclase